MSDPLRKWRPGDPHTPETKARIGAVHNEWTADELVTIRRWYHANDGEKLRLADLALQLGRNRQVVCRMAAKLGLTHRSRPTGRKPTAKHPTLEAARAAVGAATRARIAEKGHPRGALGLKHTPEARAKMAEASRVFNASVTPEQRSEMTDKSHRTLMERYGTLAPANDPAKNPYSRTKYGRREDLGGRFFRSSWEANYARYLNWLQDRGQITSWEYECDTFWFEAIRRGVRSYKPDFKVTELSGAVHYDEVKGWMDAKSKTKIARMARYYPDVDLRVVGEKQYREIERLVGRGLPNWECRA